MHPAVELSTAIRARLSAEALAPDPLSAFTLTGASGGAVGGPAGQIQVIGR